MPTKLILLGSSGMIGGGALLEAIENPEVESVLVVNRRPMPARMTRSDGKKKHPKIKELLLKDFYDVKSIADQLNGYDACLFCLGQSAVGMSEQDYHRITYELTIAWAEELLNVNSNMRFIYVSGGGTDSTEKGSQMWARVKGKTENALLKMPFRDVIMFRPGFIQPRKGIRSRTSWYNVVYTVFFPLYFLLYPFKGIVTDTTRLGRALVRAAINGADKNILQQRDINRLAEN